MPVSSQASVPPVKQRGAIPVSALSGRPSASGDAARMAQIETDLALTPLERVKKALALGILHRNQSAKRASD